MTIFIDLGGLAINSVEVDGATSVPDGSGGGNTLYPAFFVTSMFFLPLIYGGGLSDLFCAKAVPDSFNVLAVPDSFTVPAGKTSC